ncbi:hypothetical protein SAMN04487765_1397 [Tenacibaculum sp. MAR_2010_89]|uniref:hypothetical protein n=1 Tax=Tenacibaculum sp. MAR_2010_89 TaxID=1250198 RepID=UPI0008999D4A|nr:hypothetical protein [Tenacibaculum sp. MAR_2010_89]SEE09993.1 hypothetical protein SAMN04487765_1397 [Tenacibaculum sp. MAR_2010_89]
MKTNHLPSKKTLNLVLKLLLCFNCAFTTSFSSAQQKKPSSIIKNFQEYTSNYRETAYCHLNKSTYIKGEMLGFSSYVIDKTQKKASQSTKNLYCVITDKNNKIIKSQLLKINKGVAHNIFRIDSLFTTGQYTFKAYTNWMKNFDEPNAYIESFNVIDPKKTTFEEKKKISNVLDVQLLPEGGHFVRDVKTNVGVAIKNEYGYGVPDIEGSLYDSNNQIITTFKTNFLGIGKFLFVPKTNKSYTVKINHLNKEHKYAIAGIKNKGITIRLNQSNSKVAIELNTNRKTLKNIKNKPFKLIIHNGNIIKEGTIKFKKTKFVKVIDYKNLLPGVNVFTLFDTNNNPILERVFFNYNGINIETLGKSSFSKVGDSLKISIPFAKSLNETKNNIHLSVSVLPKETNSYQKNHNIISYTHLQPYLKGYIENAGYYFSKINRKKKYDLDNLLITQGWSSYEWSTIFNSKPINSFPFENGIVVKVNKNNLNNSTFFLSSLKSNNATLINLPKDKKSFSEIGLYPQDEETIDVSVLNKKGKLIKPNLYLQFYPNKVPKFDNLYTSTLSPKSPLFTLEENTIPFTKFELNDQQNLDEVTIKGNIEQKRIDKIEKNSWGDVYIVNDFFRDSGLTLAHYINAYIPGFSANEYLGEFIISSGSSLSFNGSAPPLVLLDGMIQSSNDFLYHFNMSHIDYIIANRHGLGEGVRGANGVIKIYTLKTLKPKKSTQNIRKFQFPLTFSSSKKFYVPKYKTYHDTFYNEYGVIDWIPNPKIDQNGNLTFKIHNPANTSITFFIEGMTQKGTYIVGSKTLNTGQNQ